MQINQRVRPMRQGIWLFPSLVVFLFIIGQWRAKPVEVTLGSFPTDPRIGMDSFSVYDGSIRLGSRAALLALKKELDSHPHAQAITVRYQEIGFTGCPPPQNAPVPTVNQVYVYRRKSLTLLYQGTVVCHGVTPEAIAIVANLPIGTLDILQSYCVNSAGDEIPS